MRHNAAFYDAGNFKTLSNWRRGGILVFCLKHSFQLIMIMSKTERLEGSTNPLFCPEKLGPLGQVRDRWLCLGVLCLKMNVQHRTSNFQRRIMVRLRRFNFIKKMSEAISTFDVRC